MSRRPGLWISIDPTLSESIARSIQDREQFTTTIAAYEIKPRYAELIAVSLDGNSVQYLGVCQRGRQVVTGQVSVLVTNLHPVDVSASDIRADLPKRFRDAFQPPRVGAYRPTPRLWEEVLASIGRLSRGPGTVVSRLQGLVAAAEPPPKHRSGGLEVFERDAIASMLQTWGGTARRRKEMRKIAPVAPFLKSLRSAFVREDPLVNHDHLSFPGLSISRRDVVGSIVMSDDSGSQHLTIVNCNRQPLERTLGVDLAYYNHSYDSFVFVQYKRMVDNNMGIAEYRPPGDRNHDHEIDRMTAVDEHLLSIPEPQPVTMTSFRLASGPFYLKLCRARAKAALDAGMVPGMYFPLRLWRVMLDSPEMLGPRGGLVMTWENARRRFNNSEFSNLLRGGWIGSAGAQSANLNQIVEESLSRSRMVVIGATSSMTPRDDARRDSLGRFAAPNDPDAST